MMERAQFIARTQCVGCRATRLLEVSSGLFDASPLHDFLSKDPWGESPIPYLVGQKWRYVQCSECALRFHQYILSPEWNTRKFECWMSAEAIEQFERSHSGPQTIFERTAHFAQHVAQLEYLTRNLRGANRLKVLDFGCGNGRFIELCSAFGFDAFGVDRSAARRGSNRAHVFESLADVQDSVHVVTLFEVLEHLDEPRGLLESLAPLLVPGGILVLETPDCTGVDSIESLHDYAQIHPLEHINGFTPDTLREFAERVGFRAINMPISHFTCEPKRVIRQELKRVLPFAVRKRTQQYFAKVG
jgi:SAM-dependent methyltransferase